MKRFLMLWLLLGLLLAACNGDDKKSDESVDANQLITQAAQKLDAAQSFQLSLAIEGAPVLLDSGTIGQDFDVALTGAQADFVRPNSLGGTVKVALNDISTEVGMVAIGADQYLNHPLITLGKWQALTFSQNFDATTLVSGDDSIANALRAIQKLEYVDKTDLDGVSMFHVRGEVAAERVRAVTVGLIGTEGIIKVDAYIRTDNQQLEQMVLLETIGDQTTTWTIGIYGYNGEYTVTRPEVQ